MTDIEHILKTYEKESFDPKQPFLQAVYHLTKTHSNDYTLGSKVRELIQKFETVDRERIKLEMDEQLKNILENNG